MHKAGFVNIIGNPNVGKSTLMNKLTGEKLAVTTPKEQTTRHRIMGIVSGKDFQIVYSDTPGILQPKYKLQQSMLQYIEEALSDADIFVFVTDPKDSEQINVQYLDRLKKMNIPIILVLNKIDLINQQKAKNLLDEWKKLLPNAELVPLSALHNFNIQKITNFIIDFLPKSPPYFEKDRLTDKPMRFFVSEIIRGKILEQFRQEIPYSTQVTVEAFKEYPKITKILATIYVERESQKPIIIGNKGQAIKRLGIEARKEIEKFVQTKIYLELFVKVNKDWRNNPTKLKRFGYQV